MARRDRNRFLIPSFSIRQPPRVLKLSGFYTHGIALYPPEQSIFGIADQEGVAERFDNNPMMGYYRAYSHNHAACRGVGYLQ
jgi:hypothetical protein